MSTCHNCGTDVTAGALFCAHCGSQVDAGGRLSSGRRRPSAESIASGEQRLLQALRACTQGEFEILGEIGRGGMAVVFLAQEISLNRQVAIKVMTPALMMMDEGIQARFKREAQTAASLSHPHIIPVYSVRENEDLVYFVMKYIVGRSLESVVKEIGPLPIPVIQRILSQAGNALAHAHRKGVVHRDIKPGNIMLDEDGWVVVADFGIAKVADAEALTMTGGLIGTPAYMSPEQCTSKLITGAADQYSLGVVAYEMLTGKPPFQSGTMVNLIYDHCHTPPVPVRELRDDCPEELAAVVMRMLEKDSDFRFPSVEDAVSAIGDADDTQESVRTQMLTMAQATDTAKLLDKFRTPGSPIPQSRVAPHSRAAAVARTVPVTPPLTPVTAPPAPAPRRLAKSKAAWAAPAVVVAAVAGWLVLGNRQDDTAGTEQRAEIAASETVTTAPSVSTLDVTPVNPTLTVGGTTRLSATPRGPRGRPITESPVTFESLHPAIASVTTDGNVTAMSAGTASIIARADGSSATIVVTVRERARGKAAATTEAATVVASVGIEPVTTAIRVGESAQLRVRLRDAAGNLLDGSASWSTSDASVVTVTQGGFLTAVGTGTAQVSATSEGSVGSTPVTVQAAAVATISVSPSRAEIAVGETLRLSATLRDARGTAIRDREVFWRSSDPTTASVSGDGDVTGVSPGSVTVSAGSEEVSATAAVAVEAPAPAPTVDPRPEIERLLEDYRQAIESRDLAQLKFVYPAMTADQEKLWRTFFGNVSELRATFNLGEIQISADRAMVKVEAVYEFRARRLENQPVTIIASFQRTGGSWQLINIQ